jgi:DNA polymerase-4
MGPMPTVELWGIGRKTADKLESVGIRTVEELADADEDALARRFGPSTGPWLRSLGLGEHGGRVTDEPYVPRGQSREHTFQRNLTDPAEVRANVLEMAGALLEELRRDGRPIVRIVVKIRFAPFFTHTHGAKLPEPSLDDAAVRAATLRALERFDLDRPVRLVGVRAELAPPGDQSGAISSAR